MQEICIHPFFTVAITTDWDIGGVANLCTIRTVP